MSALIDSKLAERVKEKLKHEDEKAIEMMAGGNLRDFGEYRHSSGYRRALKDAIQLIDETLDEIMKE